MKPDELRFANVLADAIGKRVAGVLANVAREPNREPVWVGRETLIDRTQRGTALVDCLNAPGLCPSLYTLFVRGNREDNDPTRAGLGGNVTGRLTWWHGSIGEGQQVFFDVTEGGAVVTVPAIALILDCGFQENLAATWQRVRVRANVMPGALSQRRDLTFTTTPFTLENGTSAVVPVPPYAWGVQLFPVTQGSLGAVGTNLIFFAGDTAATQQIASMNSGAVVGSWVNSTVGGAPITLPGGTRSVQILVTAGGPRTLRLVFQIRI